MIRTLELDSGGWAVEIVARGGGLARCAFAGHEILRPTPQPPFAASPAPDLCYYPLVPFFNRIENGRLRFAGRDIELGPTLAGDIHALHGHGWRREWLVLAADTSSCSLGFEHRAAPDWPWSYRATQSWRLAPGVLTVELALENLADEPMPAGLGFHPYFPGPGAARLTAAARRISLAGAEQFPSGSVPVPPALDFERGRAVRDATGIDHCYSGWRGFARIEWDDRPWRLELRATHLEHLHLYVPEGRDFFCVEPVSHSLDAFNHRESAEHAPPSVAPGATLTASLEMRAEDRGAARR